MEILTLFALILIHELGHVTAAWSFGWKIHSLELLPFGGVAQMEEWGTAPAREEIMVALAGPFYHLYMILFSIGFWKAGWWEQAWTEYFVVANLSIALFNLLPIYPLDGGRIVQALLSKILPYQRCLQVSLYSSFLLSFVFAGLSFWFVSGMQLFPFLIIAGFLIFSNYLEIREQKYPLWRMLFHRYHQGAKEWMPHREIELYQTDSVRKVLSQWYKECYHVIRIYDQNGKSVAILPEEVILKKLFQHPKEKGYPFLKAG